MPEPSGGPGVRVATVVTVAATVAVAGSFLLPWARSGRALRSGFDLARTVDVLGLAGAAPLRALLVGVWLTPMLAGMAWTAAALGRSRAAAALAALSGVLALAAGGLVLAAGGVTAQAGCWAGMVAGAAALTGSALVATMARRWHD